MQLNIFDPEVTYLRGHHTGDLVPQQPALLDLLEAYSHPSFSRVGFGYNHRVIVKVLGYSKESELPGALQIVYCQAPDGSIHEFTPFEMFSDVKIEEVASSWGTLLANEWASLTGDRGL